MKTHLLIGRLFSEQPLATCSKDLKDSYEARHGANRPIPVPVMATARGSRLYFPATGIRASLRRSCRDVIRSHVIASTGDKTPFSLDEHYLLTLGGIKSSGEGDRASIAEEARWRGLNPLLSLFGAGAAGFLGFVEGHLHVGNAITEEPCDPVSFSGARTDDLYRDKTQIRYLSDDDISALIARSRGNKSRSNLNGELNTAKKALRSAKSKGSESEIAAAEAVIAQLEAQIKLALAESGAGDVSVGMPLAGYQAIPQGVKLDHTLRIVRGNDVELGCLLASLNAFAALPVLGAHKATGCGLVSGRWEVFEVTAEAGKQSLGEAILTPFEPLELSTTVLNDKMAVFRAFLDSGKWDFGIPHAE
jgi:hypothetical protein